MLYTDVPFVIKYGSKTAIVTERRPKGLRLICMSSNGLKIKELSIKEVNGEWGVFKKYPAAKAALVYFRSAMQLSGSDKAILTLRKIVMQYIISQNGQVKHAVPHLQDAVESYPDLDITEVYHTIEDLEKLSVTALTDVFNSCVPENEQIPSFNEGFSDAARTAHDALEKKFNTKVWAMKNSATHVRNAGVNKLNKTELLVNKLIEGPATLLDLVIASGSDENNARTCIGILRSKKKLDIAYDKQTKLYTLKVD